MAASPTSTLSPRLQQHSRLTPQPSALLPLSDIHPIWGIISVLPIAALGLYGIWVWVVGGWRVRNEERRREWLRGKGFLPVRAGGEGERKREEGKKDGKELRQRKGAASSKPEPALTIASTSDESRPLIVGFWHPYCNAGGGGERVLWTAISSLIQHNHDNHPKTKSKANAKDGKDGKGKSGWREIVCVVYTGDYPAVGREEILGRVETRFSLPLLSSPLLSSHIHLLPLPLRPLISDTYWKRFTLLGQSLGSVVVAAEGVGMGGWRCGERRGWRAEGREGLGQAGFWPDVFIDSMGSPLNLPLINLLSNSQTPTAAYVHYPVISTDMVGRVRRGEWGVESGGVGVGAVGGLRKWGKLVYYYLFTRLVALALLFSDVTMANSTWTHNHVASLLKVGRGTWMAYFGNLDGEPKSGESVQSNAPAPNPTGKNNVADPSATDPSTFSGVTTIYPPCDTHQFLHLPLPTRHRSKILISLAQFRPEKDQALQIRALARLLEVEPRWREEGVELVLMGSCRDEGDERRVEELRELARELGLEDRVQFVVNAPFPDIVEWLGKASIGLNTMRDEHFGISVVEFMAAGLIPVVHASAGPLLDIVTPYQGQITGFHATGINTFASQISHALSLAPADQTRIRTAARQQALEKFSQAEFERKWLNAWGRLVGLYEERDEVHRNRGEMERKAR